MAHLPHLSLPRCDSPGGEKKSTTTTLRPPAKHTRSSTDAQMNDLPVRDINCSTAPLHRLSEEKTIRVYFRYHIYNLDKNGICNHFGSDNKV